MNSEETSRLAVFEGKQIRKAFHKNHLADVTAVESEV